MPVLDTDEFFAAVPAGGRLLALDVGTKTIGLATGVQGEELALPLKTLHRVKFTRDARALLDIIKQYDVKGLVIGWPLGLDGSVTRRCQSVRDFTAELDRFLQATGSPLPIVFADERFSTRAADELAADPDAHLTGQRDAIIDALAAQRILADFLVLS